jgi:polysaccharide biosynthesis/export protein
MASRMRQMNRSRLLPLLFAVAAGLGLAGCERPPLDNPAQNLEGPYRLDSGDELRVVVYDQPSLTNIYEVDQSGRVSLPLIGEVEARGKSTDALESTITSRYASQYLRDPDSTVEVANYRPFFVLGEVGTPGQYSYFPGMTAETAIAKAGGFSDRANKRFVRVSRRLEGRLFEGRIAVTEPIRPGDTIYVPESLF